MTINKAFLKEVIIFASGGLIGCGIAYIFTKKQIEAKCDKDIEDVKRAFAARLDELEGEKENATKLAEDVLTSGDAYKNGRIGDNEATREALKGIGMVNGIANGRAAERVDYTLYSKESTVYEEVPDPAGDIAPSEDDDEPEDLGDGRVLMPNGDVIHNKDFVSDRKESPYEIAEEECGSLLMAGYSHHEMLYYMVDRVLTDENNEIVDNPGELIGNILEDSGFDNDNRLDIYVRNDRISADFRISKVRGSYGV